MVKCYEACDVQALALIKHPHMELEPRACGCGWMQDNGSQQIRTGSVRSDCCSSRFRRTGEAARCGCLYVG